MTEKKKQAEKFSKYEKARVIGSRALQISMGAPFNVKLSQEDLEKMKFNPLEIAKLEYEKGAIPMAVTRVMPKQTETPVDAKPVQGKDEKQEQ